MNEKDSSKRVGWIISNDESIVDRLDSVANSLRGELMRVQKDDLQTSQFVRALRPSPAFVILDIDHDLDWGVTALKALKCARLRSPILVVSDDFSRDFGRKIVSKGVQYYFGRDFSREEALELLGSFFAMNSAT